MTRFTATERDADGEPRPVLAEWPDAVEEAPAPAAGSINALVEAAGKLMRLLIKDDTSSTQQIGERVLALGYLMKLDCAAQSVRQLAARGCISKSKAADLAAELRGQIE